MSGLFWILIIPAAVLLLSLALTAAMVRLGPMLGLVDMPDERRIHLRPIPRAGGLGLFVSMVSGLLLLSWKVPEVAELFGQRWLSHFLAGSLLLVAVGIQDDRRGVSAWIKLGVQSTAAIVMFAHNPGGAGVFMGIQIPWLLDLAIHVGWTVALVNAFNLIDGMDGLCAGLGTIALFVLTGLAIAQGRVGSAVVMAMMAMALLGFLRYNFHPARIFLGDTGSMLIGFFLASVGTATVGRHAVIAGILLPLLVGAVPLLDVSLAIWRRSARRIASSQPGQAAIRIFGPDRDHLHHRLLRWGFNQRQASILIYGLAIVFSLLGLLPIIGGANQFAVLIVGLVVILLVGLRYLAPVEFMASGRGLRAIIRRPRSSLQLKLCYVAYDMTVLTAAGLVSGWLIAKAMVQPFDFMAGLRSAVLFAVCVVVAICFARGHARRWTRASAHDFAECGLWIFCGAGVSFALNTASQYDFSFREALFHVSALTLGAAAIFAPRCIGFLLQEGVINTMHRKRRLRHKASNRTTIIYGAGDLGELFLCHLRLSQPELWQDFHFVGFIDDSDKLAGRRMRGFPILGTSADLPALVKRTGANSILITSSVLQPGRMEQLMATATTLRLQVSQWMPDMTPVSLRDAERGFVPIPAVPASLLSTVRQIFTPEESARA